MPWTFAVATSRRRLGDAAAANEIKSTGTVASYRLALAASIVNRCAAFIPGEAGALYRELATIPPSYDPLVAAENESCLSSARVEQPLQRAM